jgi:class 3 adenylate cyclase/tetratricopeptide (TPR) repeat protein
MDPDTRGEVRKTVTVLFVDMVGSTDLGERLDPEVLREVMQRYYERMAAVVQQRGGTVEKFIGDAIFAVFGVPQVGEDDAMRAVEAADEMRSSLATLNAELTERWGVELQTRAGVSTGEIVVGDEARVDQLVMGDVANVAARLQSAAGAGEVVVAGSTARLVRGAVDLEQIEPLTLKGKRDPVIAFRVLGLLAPEARTVTSAPFVGRTAELEALEAELSEAIRLRSCRFAAIVGDPGIGKSRLVSEFVARRGSSATVLRTQCAAHGQGSAMHPFADLVRQLAGIAPTDDRRGARAKLEAFTGRMGAEENAAGGLASLLDLMDSVRPLENIYRGVRRVLESVARSSPAVLVIEDLHHADRATFDLIEYLLRVTSDTPALIVATERPTLVGAEPFVPESGTTISLAPLPTEEARMLIDGLVGTNEDSLGGARIEAAAEGNPLFIEQLALMLQEPRRGSTDEASGSGVAGDALDVPPSISALLDTRVHALSPEERIVVQRGSVLGRSFELEAVAELLPESARPTLTSVLERLVRAGILRVDVVSAPGDASFAHGLIRDSAYRSLLKSQRADLHERCADHLERTRGERVTEHSVSIGSHLEEAVRNRLELGSDREDVRSLSMRAARWLATAGRAATARGDAGNAVDLLGRAAALLPEDEPQRLAVLADLGMARSDLGELALAEAALSEVVTRSSPAGALHWRAQVDLAQLVLVADPGRMGPDAVRRTAEDAIEALAGVRDERGLARASYTLASVHFVLGRTAEGLGWLDRALVHAQRANDARTIAGCVGDMGYVFLYDATPAAAANERLARLALTFPDARASVLGPMAAFSAMLDRFDEARRSLDERRSLAEEFGQRWALAQTEWWAGFVETLAGELTSAESRLRAALAISTEMGIPRMAGGIAGDLAEVVYQLGRPEEAFAIAEELRTNPPGEDVLALLVWRGVHGKVLAARGSGEEAEQEVREALLVAERAGAALIAGRCHMDLAEVLMLNGKKDEAVRAVDGAVRWYAAKGSLPSVRAAERMHERILAGHKLGSY